VGRGATLRLPRSQFVSDFGRQREYPNHEIKRVPYFEELFLIKKNKFDACGDRVCNGLHVYRITGKIVTIMYK